MSSIKRNPKVRIFTIVCGLTIVDFSLIDIRFKSFSDEVHATSVLIRARSMSTSMQGMISTDKMKASVLGVLSHDAPSGIG